MNSDLEATLEELGEGYREVVCRLRRSRTAEDCIIRSRWKVGLGVGVGLVAAGLATALLFPAFIAGGRLAVSPSVSAYMLAHSSSGDALDELLRTQRADGSWDNDFLTRQNAAALQNVGEARIAYRRALRYLRAKGLKPFTSDEMKLLMARANLIHASS